MSSDTFSKILRGAVGHFNLTCSDDWKCLLELQTAVQRVTDTVLKAEAVADQEEEARVNATLPPQPVLDKPAGPLPATPKPTLGKTRNLTGALVSNASNNVPERGYEGMLALETKKLLASGAQSLSGTNADTSSSGANGIECPSCAGSDVLSPAVTRSPRAETTVPPIDEVDVEDAENNPDSSGTKVGSWFAIDVCLDVSILMFDASVSSESVSICSPPVMTLILADAGPRQRSHQRQDSV